MNVQQNLQPGSWTEAEVDALDGKRIRFRNRAEGVVSKAVGFKDEGGIISLFAVEVIPDGGNPITLSRGDAEEGAWAFDVIDEED
jgi:hypothetical protein